MTERFWNAVGRTGGRWVNRQWRPDNEKPTTAPPQSNPNFDPNIKYSWNMNKKAIWEVIHNE